MLRKAKVADADAIALGCIEGRGPKEVTLLSASNDLRLLVIADFSQSTLCCHVPTAKCVRRAALWAPKTCSNLQASRKLVIMQNERLTGVCVLVFAWRRATR